MNKKGDEEFLGWNLAYLILFVIFMAIMILYISSLRDGVKQWEDFYTKEIARAVDNSEPGDIIYIDVSRGARIAESKGKNIEEAFSFSNGVIVVSLRPGSATSFGIFNDVSVQSYIEPLPDSVDGKQLVIRVGEKNV